MTAYRRKLLLPLTIACISCCSMTAWAGEWIQDETGAWIYEEGQDVLKGWQKIDGRWYCLDSETGVWEAKPQLTREAACHLLENKLQDMGLYQDEEEELQYKADYETDKKLEILVGYEEKPEVFHTINVYEVDKKTGMADPAVGDKEIALW